MNPEVALDLAEQAELHVRKFVLFPRYWQGYGYADKLDWDAVPFEESSKGSVPDEAGVYAFVVRPGVAPNLEGSYLQYVGETNDLRRRFGEYLGEAAGARKASTRMRLYRIFDRYDGYVHFTFALTEPSRRKEAEEELLRALWPPCNSRLPAEIAPAVRAMGL